MRHKTNTFIFFLILSLNVISQTTDLVINEKYVIYKRDTFNRYDERNMVFGKGLAFFIDTITTISGKTTTTVEQSDKIIRFDSTPGFLVFKIDTHVVGKGYYNDNKKVGVWFYSSKENIDKPDAKVTFDNGKITEIICYSDSTKQKDWYKIKDDKGKLKLFWFNSKSGKFEERNNFDVLVDIYHLK